MVEIGQILSRNSLDRKFELSVNIHTAFLKLNNTCDTGSPTGFNRLGYQTSGNKNGVQWYYP